MPSVRLIFEAQAAQAIAKINEVTASFKMQRTIVAETAAASTAGARELVAAEVQKQASLRNTIVELRAVQSTHAKGTEEWLAANRLKLRSEQELLATIRGTAVASATSARRGAAGALGNVGRVSGGGSGLRAVTGVGAPAAAALAVGFGLFKSVKIAADYQQQMNILAAVTHAAGGQMKAAGALAKQLGNDIRLPATSAKDAGIAMTELAKGGLSLRDSMKAARGTLQLAAAAEVDAGTAAKISANALNAFGLSGDRAGKVADVLAAAANASTGEITDYGIALGQAGAQGHSAGLSITDTVTAIALMTKAGLSASDAGTSLRTMLQRLTPQSKQAASMMKILGVNVYDAHGKMLPFRQTVIQYHDALVKLTPKQRNMALQTIFGSDAQRAANIIFANSVGVYDKMHGQINRNGEAARLAAAKTKGFHGAMEALRSALETLGITLGQVLLPMLTTAARRFAAWIAKVEESGELTRKLKEGVHLFSVGLTHAVQVIHVAVTALKGMSDAVGGAKNAFLILLGVMALGKLRAVGVAIQTSLSGSIDKARMSMRLAEGESTTMFTAIKLGARTTALVIKSALISTGIGALIVAMGFAVEYTITHWSKVKVWIRDFGIWLKTKALQIELDFYEPFSHLPGRLGKEARAAKQRISGEMQHMDAIGMKAGNQLGTSFTAASKEKMAELPKWAREAFQVKLASAMANAGTVSGAQLVSNLEAQLKTLPGWAQKQIAPKIRAAILGAAAQDAPGSSVKGQVGTGQHPRASGTRANPAAPTAATRDLRARIESETGATASAATNFKGHADTSFHYSGQALDITGTHAQLVAAWNLLFPHRLGLAELFWNGGGFWKNGQKIGAAGSNKIKNHDKHIHVGFTGTKQELDIGFDPKAAGSAKPKDSGGKPPAPVTVGNKAIEAAAAGATSGGGGKKRAKPSGQPMYGQTLVNYIATRSKALGLDPAAVLAVASVEGGFNGTVGDNGTSFGPFQLHAGGALPQSVWAHGAIYARAWANTPAGVDHALKGIAEVAGGAKGAGAVSLIVSKFERPSAPGAEIRKATGRLGSTPFKIDPRGMQGVRDARAPSGTAQTGLRGAIDAIVKVFKDLGPTVRIHLSAAALDAERHLEALRKSITINMGPADLARTRVAMARWKKILTDGIKDAKSEANQLLATLKSALTSAFDRLEKLGLRAIDRQRAPARKAIEDRAETPNEKIMREHDEAQTQRGLTQSLASAQKQLSEATTPEEAAAAQEAVDEAVYQQWVWDNRKLTDAQAAAADKERDDALQNFDDQTEDYKAKFTERLNKIKDDLANRHLTQAEALKRTRALFLEYKLPIENASGELASALTQAIVGAVQALTDAINTWLEAMGLIPGVVAKVAGINVPRGPDPRANVAEGRPGGVQVPADAGFYGPGARVGGAQDPEPIVITVNVTSTSLLDGDLVAKSVSNAVTRTVRRGGDFVPIL